MSDAMFAAMGGRVVGLVGVWWVCCAGGGGGHRCPYLSSTSGSECCWCCWTPAPASHGLWLGAGAAGLQTHNSAGAAVRRTAIPKTVGAAVCCYCCTRLRAGHPNPSSQLPSAANHNIRRVTGRGDVVRHPGACAKSTSLPMSQIAHTSINRTQICQSHANLAISRNDKRKTNTEQ